MRLAFDSEKGLFLFFSLLSLALSSLSLALACPCSLNTTVSWCLPVFILFLLGLRLRSFLALLLNIYSALGSVWLLVCVPSSKLIIFVSSLFLPPASLMHLLFSSCPVSDGAGTE